MPAVAHGTALDRTPCGVGDRTAPVAIDPCGPLAAFGPFAEGDAMWPGHTTTLHRPPVRSPGHTTALPARGVTPRACNIGHTMPKKEVTLPTLSHRLGVMSRRHAERDCQLRSVQLRFRVSEQATEGTPDFMLQVHVLATVTTK